MNHAKQAAATEQLVCLGCGLAFLADYGCGGGAYCSEECERPSVALPVDDDGYDGLDYEAGDTHCVFAQVGCDPSDLPDEWREEGVVAAREIESRRPGRPPARRCVCSTTHTVLARSDKAVTGGDWYGAIADQCAIGVANLRRHWRNAREDLHPSLRWDKDDKRAVPWRYFLAMAHWSAGGRACDHVNAYADDLAPLPESQRWGAFERLAAEHDDAGNRHKQDEYTAWKTACKIEGGVAAAPSLGEPWAEEWLREDGLDAAERARIYTRLCEVSSVSGR